MQGRVNRLRAHKDRAAFEHAFPIELRSTSLERNPPPTPRHIPIRNRDFLSTLQFKRSSYTPILVLERTVDDGEKHVVGTLFPLGFSAVTRGLRTKRKAEKEKKKGREKGKGGKPRRS